MKKLTLSVSFILLCFIVQGQNLIGLRGKEIRKYMKENRSEMNYNIVVNNKFNYLKYSDNSENQTLLFFLNKDSVCREVRITCDHGLKAQKIKEYDSRYKKNGESSWIENRDGKNYDIELKDGKWSFVISIKPEK
jgi:hypothetical protein